MSPQIDLGKLVGAASAPVALIIATSIFLGNLGAKYTMLVSNFREMAREYREIEDRNCDRGRSLKEQMTHYSSRLQRLMRATFWLNVAILLFILTVVFTSVGVVFPHQPAWTWITGACSMLGSLVLGYSVVMEMMENHRAKEVLRLETTDLAEVPDAPE